MGGYAFNIRVQRHGVCIKIPYKVYDKFPIGSQFVSKPDMKKADFFELLCQYNIHSLKILIGIILVGLGISKIYEHKQNDINR